MDFACFDRQPVMADVALFNHARVGEGSEVRLGVGVSVVFAPR